MDQSVTEAPPSPSEPTQADDDLATSVEPGADQSREPRHSQISRSTWIGAVSLALLLALLNFLAWSYLHPPLAAADYEGPIAGFAYNAFQRYDSPLEGKFPSDQEIASDMELLSKQTRRIRTYSSAELPQLPSIAEQYGLKVTAGVWLDPREENNRKEIAAIAEATARPGPIERVIAGNETILTAKFTPDELIKLLDEIRGKVRLPVSTAEPWHVWLRYPELAKHVDFITIHLLPYWEGVPISMGLDYAMDRYEEVKKRFPNKHVLIGEIGWPSQGDRFDGAQTSPEIQARFIRSFLARSQGKHLDYFIMEAIDQPWKTANEGRVGPYWGVYYADRTPKFDFAGPVESDANWSEKAAISSLIALLPMAWFLGAFARLRAASKIAFCLMIQSVVSLVVWLFALPLDLYLRWIDWTALLVLAPTLLFMAAILLTHGFEFSEMFWGGNLKRTFPPRPLRDTEYQPFVSVHLACCNEPPEMVIATIDSLRRLDYQRYEVLIIDNNTKDEALWKPVEEYVARLGDQFRFFHLPKWPGFKAGALNFGLDQTDPRAEVVGVVDADYMVKPDWLSTMVGYFTDPRVAVVQAPQAHRGWHRQLFRRMMSWEYDGFFRIGMHHRNERDAIIQHGTMTLIRADALMNKGRWSEWTICEDAELGLRLMEEGYTTVYVDRVQGEGLTPDDFGAFKRQRRRWALGAMQILKHHWSRLVSGAGALTAGQRYHFLTGWLSWFGDALHLVFAFAAMFWTIGIIAAPWIFSLPIMLFMIPLFGFFTVKALFGPMLYLKRVHCSLGDILGSALAGMGLSHAIAMGVFAGLLQKGSAFEVTKKHIKPSEAAKAVATEAAIEVGAPLPAPPPAPASKERQPGPFSAVREEGAMFIALMVCVIGMFISRKGNHIESAMWIAILLMQAIPYAAALACAWISALPETDEDEEATAIEEAPLEPVSLKMSFNPGGGATRDASRST